MKLSKLLTGIGFVILSSITFIANAQTTTQPSGCTWTVVSSQSGPSSAIVNSACNLNGAAIATREQRYSAYSAPTCVIKSIAPGYTVSGYCDNAQILKVIPAPTPQCYTGSTTIYQPGPGTPPFNVGQFCGQNCPYSVQPLANYSYPPLRYTCL